MNIQIIQKNYIYYPYQLTQNNDDEKTYDIIDVNQNIYNKLMNGEIKTLKDLRSLVFKEQSQENPKLDILILWKWQDDSSINNQIAVIETIFFPY